MTVVGFADARLLAGAGTKHNESHGRATSVAYLIDQDESAGRGVRRVLREQSARISTLLGNWEADPADAIHRARQSCKRARAVTHLLKPAAPYVAVVENRFFRDMQQRVAYARDAEALVEALDFLEIGVTEPRLAESVAMLRESLVARAVQNLADNRDTLRTQIVVACDELQRADRRLARLPLADLRRRDLRRGAERTWERCVSGYSQLHARSPSAGYHDWRRLVKYAAYQTQVLAGLGSNRTMTVGARLRELSALLGRAQDLELLDALLRQQPDALGIDTHVQRLRSLIGTSLGQLHGRSLEVGRDLFAADPALLTNAPEPSVTEQKQSRKFAATRSADDTASGVRHLIPDRGPHTSRRWQSR